MKNLVSVKTKARAIEILQDWLTSEQIESNCSTNTVIDNVVMKCSCGETQGKRAFYEGSSKTALVAVCDICGDDHNFASDCIEVI